MNPYHLLLIEEKMFRAQCKYLCSVDILSQEKHEKGMSNYVVPFKRIDGKLVRCGFSDLITTLDIDEGIYMKYV